jgi:alanine racemase
LFEGIVTWAEIDLDAIDFNVRAIKKYVGKSVKIIAVVKANAYGHGAVPVSRTALEAGAEMLAVHRAIEGVELRKSGIEAPILIMGYTPPDGAEMVVGWRLTPSLTTLEFARALSMHASAQKIVVPVHVKVDTGMNRYGLQPDEVVAFLLALRDLPGIFLEGLFTNFATADWADQTNARSQVVVFDDVRRAAVQAGFDIPILHTANSAATMSLPESHFNAVRPGNAMYGMEPSTEWLPVFEIHPALSLKSQVSNIHELASGAGVSYGRTFVAQKPTQVALVSIGYGDGFHRILSNKGSVLIGGRRAPIIGRVCMDQLVVNIDGIPGVKLDDEAVILGQQGQECIRATEVAALASTINYEVTTSLLPRVTRIYYKGGQIVHVESIDNPGNPYGSNR